MENKPEDTLPDKESIPSSEIVEKGAASTDTEPKPTLTLNGNKDGGERTAAVESRNDDSAEIEDSLVVSNTENENKELKTVEEKTTLEESTVNALEIVRESKEVIESELLDNKSSDSIRDDFDSNNLDISKEELGKGRRARVPNKRYSDILSPKLSEMPPTKIRRLTINGESGPEPPVVIAEPTPPINRKKKTIDMANPRYLKPFDYGWRRELVYRAQSEYGIKRPGDIYYYSPLGKKVRSMRELAECLTEEELSLEDFTFYKESLNVNDTEKEIIRDAKLRTAPSGEAKENTGKKKIKSSAGSKNVKANNNNKKVISSKSKSSKSTGFKIKFPSKSKKDRRRPKETIQDEDFDSEDQSEWDAVPINTKPQSKGGTKSKKKPSRLHLPPVVGSISPTPPLDTEDETPSPRSAQNPEFMNSYFQHLSYGYNTLISVFQHLKVQDLLRAGCVCTMWRDLASHPRLWRTVRMKNSQIHSFEGLAAALARQGTQQLDLRKMLLPTGDLKLWDSFSEAIQHVDTLRKIEFCRCPADVVEKIAASNRGLEILNATTIKCEKINLDAFGNLLNLKELRLKSTVSLTLTSDLSALKGLKNLRHLSLTSIRDLYKLDLEVLGSLVTLVSLDIGECVNLPKSFGSEILRQLTKLEKLRLEKGQGNCNTFDILETVHSMPKLEQLELVNFDIKAGFDKSLGACGNLRRLLIIPTYISQSATTNHMVLGGVLRLQATLSHFVWGVTLELLRVTELFVDQCDEPGKKKERKVPTGAGDSIPVLKPVPIIGALMDTLVMTDPPQVEILPLPNLQKLLLQNLPTTRVKILKIPFHATWRQSITDSVN